MGKKKKAEVTGDESAPVSDIFRTLFSAVEEGTASISSIFSDGNPFKRKPEEYPKGSDAAGLETGGEPKKKKEVKNEKVGKKRKREEVEREYEEKRYGPGLDIPEAPEVRVGGRRKKSDADDSEALKKEEGFDDEGKLLRTVFVVNLPLKVKKKALLKEFSRFGEVESVRIRSMPVMDTKIPRKGAIMQNKINDAAGSVHAYIVYKTADCAEASLSHNMALVAGNHIRVDRACPPRKKLKGEEAPLYDNKRTVFIDNLPFDVKDEEICQLFTGIEAVRVVRDSDNGLQKKPTSQLQTSSRTMFKRQHERTREGNRPSVAVRKVKTLREVGGGSNGGGTGKATGRKRKLEAPDSSSSSSNWKKAKKPR